MLPLPGKSDSQLVTQVFLSLVPKPRLAPHPVPVSIATVRPAGPWQAWLAMFGRVAAAWRPQESFSIAGCPPPQNLPTPETPEAQQSCPGPSQQQLTAPPQTVSVRPLSFLPGGRKSLSTATPVAGQ